MIIKSCFLVQYLILRVYFRLLILVIWTQGEKMVQNCVGRNSVLKHPLIPDTFHWIPFIYLDFYKCAPMLLIRCYWTKWFNQAHNAEQKKISPKFALVQNTSRKSLIWPKWASSMHWAWLIMKIELLWMSKKCKSHLKRLFQISHPMMTDFWNTPWCKPMDRMPKSGRLY